MKNKETQTAEEKAMEILDGFHKDHKKYMDEFTKLHMVGLITGVTPDLGYPRYLEFLKGKKASLTKSLYSTMEEMAVIKIKRGKRGKKNKQDFNNLLCKKAVIMKEMTDIDNLLNPKPNEHGSSASNSD